ncbi:hypothetical protein MYCTH_2062247 [Thermothelomyces thermophilus ATCC 42464]|uniref:O-methyltransferase-like protein n=1 Tax=Thermothelomyces thermophilus (strain ATCC 42464 / BCRC 31852 / DSM 1799) TaxID=573729 RepID=G2QCB2_THET4|nr:uncharacterized protein MYCTH_2062247 [Thermothelomyces thermophilus ATCC 42464]AEO57287.1 hypothetical protein MYCTH_2062247 [Thermothelomyces thermophilus ATCC 42464]
MAPTAATLALSAKPHVHALLKRLHSASEAQEKSLSQSWFWFKRLLTSRLFTWKWDASADDHMRDKFVALEEDKCHFMYLLVRGSGALNVVEAGTSFGVDVSGRVIATEKEPTKAARAREHWAEAGDEVAGVIELREGDLLETLKRDDMPEQVDFLLLDIWTPLALPTLKIVQPRLKKGAIVLADNTTMARTWYKEYLDYIHDPVNGFKTTEIPYSGGLQMSVYLPGEVN